MLDRKRKITIPLVGGLGNQLFQLSAGVYVEKYSLRTPEFSLEGFSTVDNPDRIFMLGDLIKVNGTSHRSQLYFVVFKLLSLMKPSIWVSEKDVDDFPLIRVSKSTKILSGYFQRCIYVDSVSSEILELFSTSFNFKNLFSAQAVNNIAVHIRFGDYSTNAETKQFHGLTAMSYYVEAVKMLEAAHSYEKIVIYSDDLQRAHSDFIQAFGPSKLPIIMNENFGEFEDLAGMSSSKGIVISNSTFSWWAAWIGTQVNQSRVVAPRPWFAIPSGADVNLLSEKWTILHRDLQP